MRNRPEIGGTDAAHAGVSPDGTTQERHRCVCPSGEHRVRLGQQPVDPRVDRATRRIAKRLGVEPVHAAGDGVAREPGISVPVDRQVDAVTQHRPSDVVGEQPGASLVQGHSRVGRDVDRLVVADNALAVAVGGVAEAEGADAVGAGRHPERGRLRTVAGQRLLLEAAVLQSDDRDLVRLVLAAGPWPDRHRDVVVLALEVGPEGCANHRASTRRPRRQETRVLSDPGDRWVERELSRRLTAGGNPEPGGREADAGVAGEGQLQRDRDIACVGVGHRP